jgi:hypothetical protein
MDSEMESVTVIPSYVSAPGSCLTHQEGDCDCTNCGPQQTYEVNLDRII